MKLVDWQNTLRRNIQKIRYILWNLKSSFRFRILILMRLIFPIHARTCFFNCFDVYINTTNKRSKKKQESTALSPDDITLMTESPVQQPVVQQFVQNQFNISQTGNGINIGHADTIEIRDGKVVTLK